MPTAELPTDTAPSSAADSGLLPVKIRRAVIGILGLLLTFALYLLIVRGPALLLDLSQMAANMFCF